MTGTWYFIGDPGAYNIYRDGVNTPPAKVVSYLNYYATRIKDLENYQVELETIIEQLVTAGQELPTLAGDAGLPGTVKNWKSLVNEWIQLKGRDK